MGKKVRCIDADGGTPSGMIKVGQEYEVSYDACGCYYLAGTPPNGPWRQDRFVDVQEASTAALVYNVWSTGYKRWTNSNQDPDYPQPLTFEEAKRIRNELNQAEGSNDFCVRVLLPDGSPGEVETDICDNASVSPPQPSPPTPAPQTPAFDFDAYNGIRR